MTEEERIKQTMEHLNEGYFKPFLASLDNLVMYIKDGTVYIHDSVTSHCWQFDLAQIKGMTPLGRRSWLRNFLLIETWEKESRSEFFLGTINQQTLN